MTLVILDRDGVINQDSDHFIKSPDEWIPLAGSLEAIHDLNSHGFTVAVATNQSGISRGLFTEKVLHSMHDKMEMLLKEVGAHVDSIHFCPHGPQDNCLCRKPHPGLYIQIAEKFATDLKKAFVIGDSFRDLQAAIEVGAQPLLVETGKGKRTIQNYTDELSLHNVLQFTDLAKASQYLIHNNS